MRLGINPFHFIKAGIGETPRTHKECIDLVKMAGFCALDVAVDDTATAEELADYIANQSLEVIQTHMPYNRYVAKDYDLFAASVMKRAKNAKIMGSKILVVHGDEFDFEHMTYSKEAALEFNYRLFDPLVEFAATNGMRVAFEDLFEDDPTEPPRFCSEVEDLCRLVDKYDPNLVGICWDSGHAKVHYGDKHIDALKVAGSRIIATHIHDNYYDKDLHLFPFMGDLDWPAFIQTLRQTGYKGDFTYELVYDQLPKALAPDYITLLRKSGEYILSL